VWFDEETRAWLEQRAWLEDMSVGEIIRNLVTEAIETGWRPKGKIYPWEKEEAAGAAATAPTVMETGGFGDPSFSDHNTNERRNQE
jgi:hypothetical protein